jgi:AraC-like DNA-binding protein
MLTAKATVQDRLLGFSHGADAYLTKPFLREELLTRLDRLILSRKKMIHKFQNNGFGQLLNRRAENPEAKFLQKVITIIHQDIMAHDLGSTKLAQELNLSESQLYRKLKAITGKSTAVFIRSIRLQKGKELILTTDRTISEVSYDVGFNDPSWFSRTFKQEFGIPPSDLIRD